MPWVEARDDALIRRSPWSRRLKWPCSN